MQYAPNMRLIRVMCSGRIDPAFILRAFEVGADGVLVTGCHPGDCHYLDGNLKAEATIGMVSKLLSTLGFEKDRLRLEWISAAEGTKFAETMNDFVTTIRTLGPAPVVGTEAVPFRGTIASTPKVVDGAAIRSAIEAAFAATGAYQCLDCGRCTSSCPVSIKLAGKGPEHEFSPRLVVKRAIYAIDDELITDADLWKCRTCDVCYDHCHLDVRLSEFIRRLRGLAADSGNLPTCAHSGVLHELMRLIAGLTPEHQFNHTKALEEAGEVQFIKDSDHSLGDTEAGAGAGAEADTGNGSKTLLFTGCLPYFASLFEDYEVPYNDIITAAVRILNAAGIEPMVSDLERCCGHDLFWSGDECNFQKLAAANAELFRKNGITQIVTTCDECYSILKNHYPDYIRGFEQEFEIRHFSEVLAEKINDGTLTFPGEEDASEVTVTKVTFADSCRLGRHSGIYEPPREVITANPQVELEEMALNRHRSQCCGVSNWLSCDIVAREMRADKLTLAEETGAETVVTSCPKCLTHLSCYLRNENVEPKFSVGLVDLTILTARALGLMIDEELGG